jgi:aspartokinase-like uncharacterized kinase
VKEKLMWIVKIGGSLLGSPELAQWLDIIARHGDGKVVIVPGGGLFADAVREAQQASHVSDAVAHELALLAMDQFGLLLAGMNPALVTARSELEIAERGWQHRGIIWLPSAMVLADASIPQTWQVTSDSLSAWLAAKLGAKQLVLVKSVTFATADVQTLIDNEVLDAQFAAFAASADLKISLLHKADHAALAQGFTAAALAQTGLRLSF